MHYRELNTFILNITRGINKVIGDFLKKYKSFIVYVFWGGVATVVNIGTFMFSIKVGWHYQTGNILGWFLAVLVTYFSNKFLVFSSPYRSAVYLLRELFSFFVVRIFALILDMLIIWLGIKILNYNSFLVKVFDNAVVGIANYVVSRWFIFDEGNF